jgi:antitoxin VapB
MNGYAGWSEFLALLKGVDVPADFLSTEERNQGVWDRDPFEGWEELAD